LIEEMGQVEFIFSDKTGTLTCNVMEFKNCSVNFSIYKDFKEMRSVFKKSSQASQEDKEACYNFFKLMAVCHSVVIDKDDNGKAKLSASSPDELALVDGSDQVGFHFTERTSTTVSIEIDHEKERPKQTYEILVEFPFDSTRKRMSNLVRDTDTNEIWLMTKGADNIMFPRVNLQPDDRKIIEEHLYYFACSGLRTLMMGQKKLDNATFKNWMERYDKVTTSGASDKVEKQLELYDELENNLQYVGCYAIEDLLQEKVPETI
jgi:magnesium-transporting ATPase (P-type)